MEVLNYIKIKNKLKINIMKKIILSTIVLVLINFQSYSQWFGNGVKGSGNLISETRNVGDYDKIIVTGSFNVSLVHGTEGKLKIKIEDNLLEYLVTEVRGNSLKIKWKNKVNINTRKGIHIVVPFTSLDKVVLTGSGEIISADTMDSNNFEVFLSGSGNIALQVASKSTEVKVTGSGTVKLLGKSDELYVLLTGSGDFNSYPLKVTDAKAMLTGSGDIELSVSNRLTAKVTGSGSITYRGNPKYQNFKILGSGDIESN